MFVDKIKYLKYILKLSKYRIYEGKRLSLKHS